MNDTKEVITGMGGSEVPSSITQLLTINQSKKVPLIESATATPKHNESSNFTDEVDNVCTSSDIKLTETPGIDKVLLKVRSSQGRLNECFITDNRTLRKKKQKCKAMNVTNKIDKSVDKDSVKYEDKFEIVASTRSKPYADAVRYDQNLSCKKDIDFCKNL